MYKLGSPLWPAPYPGNHDFQKLESSLSEGASTQVSALMADQFQRKRFLKVYSMYSYAKFPPPYSGPHPTPEIRDLN